ncbi:hypothetical protein UCRPA7_8332 [Phaeoacremonium minimum UCRPA7]|uniref:Uncharacterized protein n=1 Tax=Phaeoacremonium minimum (strain UCR-PA7) TaxID=1286976 RepID=R8BA72_PHAM7|nr:hypothetical protein UCRPA7_8332 [Phaeoacremonium minimum UCRPA7]EON96177.1 hypothetical protein UCRPA7_8332 [Phaeoacremonium minimum UCRPA7]
MPSNYRTTAAFKWYEQGAADGMRPSRLPEYETDGQGRVQVAVGEKYCRASDDDGETLCPNRKAWSSLGALKKHIKVAHGLEVAPSVQGSLTSFEDNKMAKFYRDMYRLATGEDVELSTPRKAKAVAADKEALLALPLKENGTPDFDKMKNATGRACPPPSYATDCVVWRAHRHPDLGADEEISVAVPRPSSTRRNRRVSRARAATPPLGVSPLAGNGNN